MARKMWSYWLLKLGLKNGMLLASHVCMALLVLSGCASPHKEISDWTGGDPGRTARVGGMELRLVDKGVKPYKTIYIEGDGRAYLNRNTVSPDPTPLNPVALTMMLTDKKADSLYIARPCQWVRGGGCRDYRLWTEKRFSLEIVDVYVELIARESAGQPIELVGYSGGAFLALQAAARLDNVVKVTTISGNLMPAYVNKRHRVSAIPVAAYPAGRLADVPVDAYVGTRDVVVGRDVVDAYMAAVGAKHVRVIEVDKDHSWQ